MAFEKSMSTNTGFMYRWAWLLALLGGVGYIVLNVLIEVGFPEHWSGADSSFLGLTYVAYSRLLWIPLALMLASLIDVYRRLGSKVGRIWKMGFLLAAGGFVLDILGNLIEFWGCALLLVPILGPFSTGSECSNFGYSISGYGTIFLMVGLLLMAVGSLRSDLAARWRNLLWVIGLVYASALIFFAIGPQLLAVHAVLFGVAWIFLGYLLMKD